MDLALVANQPVSPLLLADHLITLAEVADRAGFRRAANTLVTLVYDVLDDSADGATA